MDPGVRGNMLPEILYTSIHQLQSIQRTAAQFRGHGRMGGHSVEVVADLVIGHGAFRGHAIDFAGMPAKSRVHPIKYTVPRHKPFSGTALLSRTPKKLYSTWQFIILQILFYAKRRSQRAYTQQVMSTAVAWSALRYRAHSGNIGLLTQTGQRIKFAQETNDRFSASISARECSFNAR